MNIPSESGLSSPNNPHDIRNLSDYDFNSRNLAFDRNVEESWEKIVRVHFNQRKSPIEVPSVALAQCLVNPYPHILKVGEVAVYKSGRQGRHCVLVITTFTGPDRLIDIECETGRILKVKSGSLFWEEHWTENQG